MTTKHIFTKEQRQKGGWARARAWAEWRKSNPSPAESRAREFLKSVGVSFEVEFEFVHPNGMPQFFDIFIPGLNIAVEIDGSHGWHDYNGDYDKNLKMTAYDKMKFDYCLENGIRLVEIRIPRELEKLFPKES